MRNPQITEILQQRAQRFLGERRLVVDYYRIRRRIAFPWPMNALPVVKMSPRGYEYGYPWNTWLSWEVEERLNAIAWAADLTGDNTLKEQARREITSVANWPSHTDGPPGLTIGHLMRTLVTVRRNFSWLGETANHAIAGACQRAVDQYKSWLAENLPQHQDAATIASAPDAHHLTRNILLIGTTSLAMAAMEIQHESAAAICRRVLTFLQARFDIHRRGICEGVAYDGYVLDFVADLLPLLPVKDRQAVLDHPIVQTTLDGSIHLAAPGNLINVANLSDVEAREMPFHASVHAKLAAMSPRPTSTWYLQHCRLDWLRADTLGALVHLPEAAGTPPTGDVADLLYAVTLRNGWNEDHTAVAIGATRAYVGHLHNDGGSIMIGRGGRWLLADPGYQQYLGTSERDFTLGTRAHNCPIINGLGQDRKATRVLSVEKSVDNVRSAVLDLTACYSPDSGASLVRRQVWLLPTGTVVVCDNIHCARFWSLDYAWHAIPGGSWWVQDNKAVIYHEGAQLWIASPNAAIEPAGIQRLRGSRGHESLIAPVKSDTNKISCWWVFNVGAEPVKFAASGDALTVDGVTLRAS